MDKLTEVSELTAENGRLREIIARRNQRDQVMARLNSRIRSTTDLPVILQVTAAEIGRSLKANRCFINLDIELPELPFFFEYHQSNLPPLHENQIDQQNNVNLRSKVQLTVPIMLHHELLGTVYVQRESLDKWRPGEIELVNHIAGELAILLTNARLLAENQRRVEEVNQLWSIAQMMIEESDPHQLSAQLAEQAAKLMGVEQAMVGLANGNSIAFDQIYQQGQWQQVKLQFQAGEGVAGWVLIHARPYLSHDANADPQIGSEFVQQFDCRTVLAVPILSGRRVLGIIELHNRSDQRSFDDNDVNRVQTIAHQAAIALERSQLFSEMQRRATALEILLSFSAELSEQQNPELLLQRLVEHATSLVGVDAGCGGLASPTGLQTQGYWQAGQWHEFQFTWTDSEVAGWVRSHKQPYLTNDYRHDPYAHSQLIERFNVRSALCVPILNADDQMLGFLELHNKDGGREPFSWTDVGMMESLANAAAVALGNTYLFKELDNQGTQLRALSAQLVTLLEDERRRIARELHDEAGQVLIGIKLNLRVLASKIPASLPALREEVDGLRQEVNEAALSLQALWRGLRPPTLDELGLEAALRHLTNDFEQNSDVVVVLETAVSTPHLPPSIEIACYRLVQEALTNVARHARASQAWITLTQQAEALTLIIKDDGQGFDQTNIRPVSLGLLGMRERVNMLSGNFIIESTPNTGTIIRVSIPVAEVMNNEGNEQ